MTQILTGQWIAGDGKIVADPVCGLITQMVNEHLVELARDESGWFTLFREKRNGQLWEHSYPQGHMHGGGPPQLATIEPSEATARYGDKWR